LFFNFQFRAYIGPENRFLVSTPCFVCTLPYRLKDFKSGMSTIPSRPCGPGLGLARRLANRNRHSRLKWPELRWRYRSSPCGSSGPPGPTSPGSGSHGFNAIASCNATRASSVRCRPSKDKARPLITAMWLGDRAIALSRSSRAFTKS